MSVKILITILTLYALTGQIAWSGDFCASRLTQLTDTNEVTWPMLRSLSKSNRRALLSTLSQSQIEKLLESGDKDDLRLILADPNAKPGGRLDREPLLAKFHLSANDLEVVRYEYFFKKGGFNGAYVSTEDPRLTRSETWGAKWSDSTFFTKTQWADSVDYFVENVFDKPGAASKLQREMNRAFEFIRGVYAERGTLSGAELANLFAVDFKLNPYRRRIYVHRNVVSKEIKMVTGLYDTLPEIVAYDYENTGVDFGPRVARRDGQYGSKTPVEIEFGLDLLPGVEVIRTAKAHGIPPGAIDHLFFKIADDLDVHHGRPASAWEEPLPRFSRNFPMYFDATEDLVQFYHDKKFMAVAGELVEGRGLIPVDRGNLRTLFRQLKTSTGTTKRRFLLVQSAEDFYSVNAGLARHYLNPKSETSIGPLSFKYNWEQFTEREQRREMRRILSNRDQPISFTRDSR